MKKILIMFILLLGSMHVIAQEETVIHMNNSLLLRTPWQIDQFYIDSVMVPDSLNPSPIHHYYEDGTFVRSTMDTMVTGMVWQLIEPNTIVISSLSPAQGYSESITIVYLSTSVLVTTQTLMGSDGKSYFLECRFKPYIKDDDDDL